METARAHGAITDQTDTFRPRDAITREELAVMLVRAMGYGTIAGLAQDLPIPFQDVTTNVGYVAMAYELGLIKGTSGSKFSPDSPATREQATVMLMRLYDGYHTAAPERIGIADAAEELTDLTGYEAVAVNGGRLIHAGGTRLTGQPEAEAADALREAAEAPAPRRCCISLPRPPSCGGTRRIRPGSSPRPWRMGAIRACSWTWKSCRAGRKRSTRSWRRLCGRRWGTRPST